MQTPEGLSPITIAKREIESVMQGALVRWLSSHFCGHRDKKEVPHLLPDLPPQEINGTEKCTDEEHDGDKEAGGAETEDHTESIRGENLTEEVKLLREMVTQRGVEVFVKHLAKGTSRL